jgi:hypothetical protein
VCPQLRVLNAIGIEGICDHIFLSRVIALRYPRAQVSVIHCGGDNRTKEVLAVARQMLGDLRRSPYADRIFIILDRVHEPTLRASGRKSPLRPGPSPLLSYRTLPG